MSGLVRMTPRLLRLLGFTKSLVEDEGFDPTSDDYYTELDRSDFDTFVGASQAPSKRPVSDGCWRFKNTTLGAVVEKGSTHPEPSRNSEEIGCAARRIREIREGVRHD